MNQNPKSPETKILSLTGIYTNRTRINKKEKKNQEKKNKTEALLVQLWCWSIKFHTDQKERDPFQGKWKTTHPLIKNMEPRTGVWGSH